MLYFTKTTFRWLIFINLVISPCWLAAKNKLPLVSGLEKCHGVKLQVLGSGGPEINDGLASSSYLVWIDNQASILVDLGGGSSLNFEKTGANFNHLKAILLTHLHVDHSVELPVYLKAGYFTGRETPLAVIGPRSGDGFPSTEAFVAALFSDRQASAYPYLSDNLFQKPSTDFLISAQSVQAREAIWSRELDSEVLVSAIQVNHGTIPALAWRVKANGCIIVFSGDMNASSHHLEKLADKSDILVAHNAIPEQAQGIARKLHMIPSSIAKIANHAKTKKLVLSHFMLRSQDKKQENISIISRQYAGEIILADDLTLITAD